ncbi:MAG: hypothetical protein EPN69_08340 [Rhodanobacter sp.]|nr:MAG: hypothetical protein EPN69_08340 [Rhodanobacter sp.]TAM01315.1 MAG: hypothetical protein EPN71_05680 [Rhodanobacter sp.]TAM39504.1 MAG: hypothetical protein EPN58_13565 [Rhodanobacter sp.]TAN29075.1 MAG: hypothetical protein EPN32_01635 [Rhodanobacter sp.]
MTIVIKSLAEQTRTRSDTFLSAMHSLAEKLGLMVKDAPMPISKFKSDYGSLLRGAMSGRLQQISRGSERYVVLTEDQVIAIVRSSNRRNSLADTLASIQTPSQPLDASVMVAGSRQDPYSLTDLSS